MSTTSFASNTLKTTLVLSFFILAFSKGTAQGIEKRQYWQGAYWNYGAEVSNMPLAARFAPIHSDDDYAKPSNAGPIETLQYSKNSSFNFTYGIEWALHKKVRLVLGFDWLWWSRGSKALRNYTNAVGTPTRGVGAALTYTTLSVRGAVPSTNIGFFDFLLNISPRVGFEVPFPVGKSEIFTGLSVGYFRLVGENGWDRYDALEQHRHYNLAHQFPVSVQLGWQNEYMAGFFGVSRYFSANTRAGEEANITYDWGQEKGMGFFIGFRGYFVE